ncbi:MAG TPA: ion transporter [Phycisphaerales bacterium]|nr:ion transporter [Phycisphaerales bacterium]HMP38357.1 ion transporter [Phycisphaerales bacterium]
MLAEGLHIVVESRAFQRTILAVIVVASVVVGLETYPSIVAAWGGLLRSLDRLIVAIFVVEALMKMGARWPRPWEYFRDPWNCFDFVIVVLCLIPAIGPYAAIARLARVLRALRLITTVPKLQLIVNSLLKGLPSMAYVGLLLLLLFYVYAVLGVFLFRENDPLHFTDLQTALLTMFRVVTLEDWTDVLYIQMHGSAAYPGFDELNHTGIDPVSRAQPLAAVLFFVSFVLLGTIVILNLVIGVIISSMQEAEHEREQGLLRAAKERGTALSAESELRLLEGELDALRAQLAAIRRRVGDERSGG